MAKPGDASALNGVSRERFPGKRLAGSNLPDADFLGINRAYAARALPI
jgi:hypothetical protein